MMGQQRKSTISFDHLIGAREHAHRHVEAERLGGLEVEHRLVPLGDLYAGENRARGFQDEAAAERYTGAAKRYGADLNATATRVGSYFESGGTILKGVGSFSNNYADYRGRFSGDGFTPVTPDEGMPLRINRYGCDAPRRRGNLGGYY
jgi:hypothetical protein